VAKRKKAPKDHWKWTAKDDEELSNLRKVGLTRVDIGARMDCSKSSIKHRLRGLSKAKRELDDDSSTANEDDSAVLGHLAKRPRSELSSDKNHTRLALEQVVAAGKSAMRLLPGLTQEMLAKTIPGPVKRQAS
jgi:hypothetical protein